MDLDEHLFDFSGKSDEEILSLGRALYRRFYIGDERHVGVLNNHLGEEVVFFEDRFEHAFYTSSDRARFPDKKDVLDINRLCRLQWIGLIVSGQVSKAECWRVPAKNGRRQPPNLIYILWDINYVIWLEPRRAGGWRFSTAYLARRADIRRYIKEGLKI